MQPLTIARRFTRLYVLALLGVALLSILGQILVQFTLKNHLNDSWVVNYAGRQRFQSQLITKNVVLLNQTTIPIDTTFYLMNLKTVLNNWESYHEGLKSGKIKNSSIIVPNTPEIYQLFADIDPHFYLVKNNVKKIITMLENHKADDTTMKEAIRTVLANEFLFLHKMDRIVFQYDKNAREKVKTLQQIEFLLITFTLIILLLEGFFVFRPAVNTLRKTILQLLESEKKKTLINQELSMINNQLKHSNQLLEATKEELLQATQKRYQQELNEHKITTIALLQGQEEERKRISRELHDGIGQTLTVMKLLAEKIKNLESLSAKEKVVFLELKSMIFKTIQEVRNISHDLMPTVLSDFGLASALKDLVERYAKITSAKITSEIDLPMQILDKNTEINIFRIAQEALTNAVKHSKATEIKLKVVQNQKYLVFLLVDNGIGFQLGEYKSEITKGKSNATYGLQNMKQRASLINAQLQIVSVMDRGTKVMLKIKN
ncbi:histidine kinase [Thermoflexibacter ruber]|uniref:histidine kinase n=1 Tax=Thermoflexibacter ruber TaxID=1003 RepID=A0A1I2BIS3_9BACT|nr:histidine kinase [Thermoflexibacter ruber]SFE55728.1 Signal transduction histidine kinase [Thermoflexibacter ruber]